MKYIISVVDQDVNTFKTIKIIPQIPISQLDSKLEDDEATVLLAENVLEFYKEEQQNSVLDMLVKKTRLGGQLTVSVVNGKRILWTLTENNFVNGNKLLYGDLDVSIKNVCFDIPKFLKTLESKGVKILQVLETDERNIFTCQKM